jgi:hypothetical protein
MEKVLVGVVLDLIAANVCLLEHANHVAIGPALCGDIRRRNAKDENEAQKRQVTF